MLNITDPTELYRLRDGIYAADLLIAAVAELDLCNWLQVRGSADAEQLAREHGLADRPADVLITYLVARGVIVRQEDGRLTLTTLARDHFTDSSSYDLRPYYKSLSDRPACQSLLRVLRTDQPAAWADTVDGPRWNEGLATPAFARRLTAAMDARGAFLAPQMAQALAQVPLTRLLDIGGGSGCYARALTDVRPGLHADVLERPPIDDVARTLLAARHGESARVGVVSGSMFDSLPDGYDAHLYSHVLHDWGQADVLRLLENSAAALPDGGLILVHDTHINSAKTGPLPVAEYSVLLMQATPGKCWSYSELQEMLTTTGFGSLEVRETAADRSVLMARRVR